jgi:hypothetical protein
LEVAPLIASTNVSNTKPTDHLHVQFLKLLPRIQIHAEIYFSHIKCPQKRADAIQETVASAWKWFLRLIEQGKDVNEFPTTFITLVARGVKHGRRLAGMAKSKDVMNPLAQQMFGFIVELLPASTRAAHEELYGEVRGQRNQDAFEERLRDNTQTPVPDQVAFRLDFPVWRLTRTERDRRVIDDLMTGERTQDVAAKYGLTAGRISQLRRDFMEDWEWFCGEHNHEQTQPVA